MNKTYYVYILRCTDNTLYTGITTDVSRRFAEHSAKSGAKYTKSHIPLKIEALWKVSSGRSLASRLEYRLKKLNKTEKEQLLTNPYDINKIIDDPEITVCQLKF